MVITPDDKVVITGGSTGYRGEGNSDVLLCHLYDPKANTLTRVADPTVGRNYHSEALLLPDGRVITLGSDPLYSDARDTIPGEIREAHRDLLAAIPVPGRSAGRSPAGRSRSSEATRSGSPPPMRAGSRRARLMRPSAVTHVTDVEQRSIKLELHAERRRHRRDDSRRAPGWCPRAGTCCS